MTDQPTNPHTWVRPPPGAGPQLVCRKCGIRKTVAEANGEVECGGVDPDLAGAVKMEYDPL